MRKLIYAINTSLDGFIEDAAPGSRPTPCAPVSWTSARWW